MVHSAYLWPLPYTLIGIACGLLLGGRFQCVNGVIEIHGHPIAGVLKRFPGLAVAITLGHVVLGRKKMLRQEINQDSSVFDAFRSTLPQVIPMQDHPWLR